MIWLRIPQLTAVVTKPRLKECPAILDVSKSIFAECFLAILATSMQESLMPVTLSALLTEQNTASLLLIFCQAFRCFIGQNVFLLSIAIFWPSANLGSLIFKVENKDDMR